MASDHVLASNISSRRNRCWVWKGRVYIACTSLNAKVFDMEECAVQHTSLDILVFPLPNEKALCRPEVLRNTVQFDRAVYRTEVADIFRDLRFGVSLVHRVPRFEGCFDTTFSGVQAFP